MSLFCLLWAPLFYLFWRSVTGDHTLTGGVWAALAGCAAALLQLFLGFAIDPGEFGFSRWLSGFVDIVVLPVMAPLLVYLLLVVLKIITGPPDFANFTQLWLVPCAMIRALTWSSRNDPIILILVPVLWTAISVGVPFFINLVVHGRILIIVLASFGIIMIPIAAASSYWAFFSQKSALGLLLFLAASAPMLVSIILSLNKNM